MIRSLACLFLILSATLIGVLPPHSGPFSIPAPVASHSASLPFPDPVNASLTAFNYTQAQGDLYTNSSKGVVVVPPSNATGTKFQWLSTVNRTSSGGNLIAGTGLRFNLTTNGLKTSSLQVVNYTLTIPKGSCPNCSKTEVDFNFFGNLTKGTSANFTLTLAPFNGTTIKPYSLSGNPLIYNFTGPGSFFTGPGNLPVVKILSCPEDFCIDVNKYVGLNLTLSFRFGWTASETGMDLEAREIIVASKGPTVLSTSNYMMLNSTDTTKVTHFAKLSNINYNSTTIKHIWSMEILNIYYPFGYAINQILANTTSLFPVSPRVPLENCNNPVDCSAAIIALNMSDLYQKFLHNSTVTIISTTLNTISLLNTVVSGIPVTYYVPGDNMTIRVVNAPSANVPASLKTGTLNITLVDPNGSSRTIPSQTFSTISGGNFTLSPIPTTGPIGAWSLSANFISGYDLGFKSSSFRVNQIKPTGPFNISGSNSPNNPINLQGKLAYANNSLAAGVNGVVFAVDAGTPTSNPVTAQTGSRSSTNLYIANVTLINGVFTQGQTLIMTFGVNNPTSQQFSANLTMDHEWASSQTHGTSVTFPLNLGDNPFTSATSYLYEADVSLTSSGVRIKLTSLNTLNSHSFALSIGTTPVVASRQHSGLFKITITSVTGTQTASSNSLESPPYAYVLAGSLVPGRYLASKPFTTDSTGSFSAELTSNVILGARKLVLFPLARDNNGIVLWNKNQDPTASTDNTIILSSVDPIGQATVKQTVQATLHLTNNSTKITMNITVTANLQGTGAVDTHNVIVAPGASQPVTFTFTAPQTPGSYALSFTSPQYTQPFASQTLQVGILQSNLQILLPAIIGLVAAIIVLGFYLIRRQPVTEMGEEEKKTKSTGPKPKPKPQPVPSPSPSKSLTQTWATS